MSEAKKYSYLVTQPCFREGMYFDPQDKRLEGQQVFHYTDEPQVSRALEPADEVTRKATEAKRAEFAEVKRQKDAAANPALTAMQATIAAQAAQIEKLLAAMQPSSSKK